MSKVISITVKIAGLVITAPVTWGVAGLVFGDVQPDALRLIVQVAALVVVEGVFLASWLALDGDKSAPEAVKVRHAITALVMYVGLWVLAIQHGEGLAGIVFRLALGLALVGSIYDAGIVSGLRRDAAADRDIAKDWRVKRHARNLARQSAILALNTDHAIMRQSDAARLDIESAKIALSRQSGLTAVKRDHRANLEQIDARFPYPIDTARAEHVTKSDKRKAELLPKVETMLAAGMSKTDVGRALHISRQTVTNWIAELETGGNGNHNGQRQDATPIN